METEQFKALLEYLDERIELQWNKGTIGSAFFYDQCRRLKKDAIEKSESERKRLKLLG